MPESIAEQKVDRVDELKKLIRGHGDRVDSTTAGCTAWLLEHKGSCIGCHSDLGCMKLVQLLRLHVPNDLPEERITDLMKEVLSAHTTKEVIEAYPL